MTLHEPGPGHGKREMDEPEAVGFDEAFAGLFRLAYRVSFRVLGDKGDAEDVAQETLARTHVRWSKLADRPEGWVVTVATNLAIDRQRRRRRALPAAGEGHRLWSTRRAPNASTSAGRWGACRAGSARSWCCATWPTGASSTWPGSSAVRPAR